MVARAKYTDKSRKSDFDYFIKNYKNLYKKYGHAYIVIKDKNVLGAYKDVDDAINNTKIPLGTYILQECNGKESGYTSYVTSFNLFKAQGSMTMIYTNKYKNVEDRILVDTKIKFKNAIYKSKSTLIDTGANIFYEISYKWKFGVQIVCYYLFNTILFEFNLALQPGFYLKSRYQVPVNNAMFLIIFSATKEEPINYDKVTCCPYCDDMGSYDVYYTYSVLTVFFIPVWKWNKKYIVEKTCCKRKFYLDYNVGEALRYGKDVEIRDIDLVEI